MIPSHSGGERGQVLVIVATAMFFVLLSASAVVVDLGNGFLQKRRLQSTADAAALAAAQELSRGGTAATAVSVAQAIVTNNTGGTVTLPGSPVGGIGGVNLTEGIDINGGGVRVGLINRNVQTFFSGVLGFNSLTVAARARAEVNTAGIVPIAVKRYSAGQTMWQLCAAEQPQDPPGSPVCSAIDYMNAASQPGASVSSWPAPPWPNLLTQPASFPATTLNKGPVIPIVGADAHPNPSQDHPSFNFFVAPDLRNVTGVIEAYNGVTAATTANQLKGQEADYFLPTNMGYSSAPNPRVGDELAILDGVITGMVVSRMKSAYPPGSTVTAMVYDGTVHRAPDFKLLLNQDYDDSSPYRFTVSLRQLSHPPLYAPAGVEFSVEGIDDTNFATWTFNSSSSVYTTPVNGTNVNVTLEFFPVGGTPPPTGIKSFTVKARDPMSMSTRTVSGALVFGTSENGFYGRSDDAGAQPTTYKRIGRGGYDIFQFFAEGYDYHGTSVRIGTVEWMPVTGGPWGSAPAGLSAYQTGNNANVHGDSRDALRLRVDASTTATTGEWLLKVQITNGTSSEDQYIYVVLRVLTDTSGYAANADYVYVLGFANFEICYADGSFNHPTSPDNNTIWGRAVSEVVPDPNPLLLSRGRQTRLVGWGQ